MTLRSLLTRHFSGGGAERDGDPKVDVDEDFDDLRRKWLLHGAASLGLSVANGSLSNRGGYSQPLLQRDQVTSFTTELKLNGGASTRNHEIDLQLQLQYGLTWTAVDPASEDAGRRWDRSEAQDRIAANAIYVWHQLRHSYGSARWYVPEPFVEARATTEFDAPDPPDERPHYVDFSGTMGVGLTLHPLLFVKLGAIVLVSPRGGAGADADELSARPGVYLGYQLKRWHFFEGSEHPLDLESRLDLLVTDLASRRRRGELTLESTAWFSLTHFIRLTLKHRIFLLDTKSERLAWANDLSFGLAVLFDLRRQTF
jgi:hypothetical protein